VLTWAALAVIIILCPSSLKAFEGRIAATLTRGGDTQTLLYTVATNQLRIECSDNDRPCAKNIADLQSGAITILFPHNRSFVRLKNPGQTSSSAQGVPAMLLPLAEPTPPGGSPPGLRPLTARSERATPTEALPAGIGPTNLPGVPAVPPRPAMPQMPAGVGPQSGLATAAVPGMPMMPPIAMMPPMAGQQAELKATGETTNILGYACTRYELKQPGEVMEIWATDKLLPFQPWLANQPHRFGPRILEEQWAELVKSKKLFPLLAVLKFENGLERLRFAATAIKPEKLDDTDRSLFQPPPGYQEIQPLPF
jgi:hypothetical protein